MTDRRLGGRTSAIAFVLMTAFATAAATGIFVLLDPRAQAFWLTRWEALLAFVRSLFGGG